MSAIDAFRSTRNALGRSEGGGTAAAEPVSRFVQGISINSAAGIDGLVDELHNLRERLVLDLNRIQDHLTQYAALGQAVARLTWVSAESVARVMVSDSAKSR